MPSRWPVGGGAGRHASTLEHGDQPSNDVATRPNGNPKASSPSETVTGVYGTLRTALGRVDHASAASAGPDAIAVRKYEEMHKKLKSG